MSRDVADALGEAIGPHAVSWDAAGAIYVTPSPPNDLATVLGMAASQRWSVTASGSGSWQQPNGPEKIVLSTRAMDQVVAVQPDDLVLTAQAGASIQQIQRAARAQGTWLALDPPGAPERTIGSILATATSGPLRHGFGGVREQVLGLTAVTGDGRTIRAGGSTVKNVAGFDLAKLHIGGFGAFGVITECHLRLRALPRADTTWIAHGTRDQLTSTARRLADMPIGAAAIEVFSPALAGEQSGWLLAVRLIGGATATADDGTRISDTSELSWHQLSPDRALLPWDGSQRALATPPVTLRLGVLPDAVDDTLDLLIHDLGEGFLSAGPGSGHIRWSGTTGATELRALRHRLAEREIPLTVERGPWEVRAGAGHFGAYHEGVGGLVSRLRGTFDPHRVFVVPLDGNGES